MIVEQQCQKQYIKFLNYDITLQHIREIHHTYIYTLYVYSGGRNTDIFTT